MEKENIAEVRRKVEEVWKEIKKHPETRETGIKLISRLKSEMEGRGVVPVDELNRFSKAFKAMVDSLEEDNTDE